jgi:hypothetical protein
VSDIRIVLSQEDAGKPVFELLGCPTRPLAVTVVIPRGIACRPYLNLAGFKSDSIINVENYGVLGEPHEDPKAIR